jgi:hypothetical protein
MSNLASFVALRPRELVERFRATGNLEVGNHEDDSRFWKTIQATGIQRTGFGQRVTAFWKQRPGGRLSWLETIFGGPIDLLLSDVAVPEPSGTVVALELIKSYPRHGDLVCLGHPELCIGQLPSDLVDFLEKSLRAVGFPGQS